MLYTCILFQILILTANILVEAKVKNDRRRSVWSFWLRFIFLMFICIVGSFFNLPVDEFVLFIIVNIFIGLLSADILDFISYKKGRKDSKKIMFHMPITHIVYTLLLVLTLYIVEVKIISYPFIITELRRPRHYCGSMFQVQKTSRSKRSASDRHTAFHNIGFSSVF